MQRVGWWERLPKQQDIMPGQAAPPVFLLSPPERGASPQPSISSKGSSCPVWKRATCRCGCVGKGSEPPGGAAWGCAQHRGQEPGTPTRSIAVSPASSACVGCAVTAWLPDRAEQEKADPGAELFLQVCCW